MRYIRYLLIAVIGAFFILVGLFNSGKVTIDYFVGQRTIPLFLVMLLFFILGAVIALLVFGTKALYWKKRAKSAEKILKKEHQDSDHSEIEAQFHQDNQYS